MPLVPSEPRVTAGGARLPIGIFARTFPGTDAANVLAAVASAGFDVAQFNLSSAGFETVPSAFASQTAEALATTIGQHNVSIVALSGTCNIAHPVRSHRDECVRRLTNLAQTCQRLVIPVLTLATGTRHTTELWCGHPDNQSADAHRDLRHALRTLLAATVGTGVTLAFEPEHSNIIQTADQARDLLDEIGDPRLAIILDLANLIGDAPITSHNDIMRGAARSLRGRIALAHAKDIAANHEAVPPGRGVIDFTKYFRALVYHAGYTGPVIMHGLAPNDVAASRAHLHSARAAALAG